MTAALVFALFLVFGVGLALVLAVAVWSEWPAERELDRESAEDVARRDRDR